MGEELGTIVGALGSRVGRGVGGKSIVSLFITSGGSGLCLYRNIAACTFASMIVVGVDVGVMEGLSSRVGGGDGGVGGGGVGWSWSLLSMACSSP